MHLNTKYSSFAEALQNGDGLCVIGVFLTVSNATVSNRVEVDVIIAHDELGRRGEFCFMIENKVASLVTLCVIAVVTSLGFKPLFTKCFKLKIHLKFYSCENNLFYLAWCVFLLQVVDNPNEGAYGFNQIAELIGNVKYKVSEKVQRQLIVFTLFIIMLCDR